MKFWIVTRVNVSSAATKPCLIFNNAISCLTTVHAEYNSKWNYTISVLYYIIELILNKYNYTKTSINYHFFFMDFQKDLWTFLGYPKTTTKPPDDGKWKTEIVTIPFKEAQWQLSSEK